MPFLFITIPILLFLIFFAIERRSVWIGLFFILLTAYLAILTVIYLDFFEQRLAFTIVVVLGGLTIILTPFYILSFIFALFSSGIRLIKREGRKLHNFLSLALGSFIIIWPIALSFFDVPEEKVFLSSLAFLLSTSVSYIFILMISFALAAFLNRFRNPFKTYDYIIVLGSGLIGDKVPPLLANRIHKGIELFHKFNSEENPVKVVFTGGQGSDELLPEGVAMARYAQEMGLPEESIIIEDQAVSTYENLLFSKKLIDEDWRERGQSREPALITVTNNFHVFRSLLWARKVGVKSDGAGAPTRFYFWLNALIREFIAVLFMQRRFHLLMFGLIFLLALGHYITTKFFVLPFSYG